jgi:hypothetical protein
MLFSASANAQIVYTDIIPDTVLTNPGNYNLDLNNDGQIDFTFYGHLYAFTCGGGGCPVSVDSSTISPTSLNWVSDTVNGQVAKLNSGDLINASSPLWTNDPSQALYIIRATCAFQVACVSPPFGTRPTQLMPNGIWSNVSEKYVALKIQVSGNIYYGWARLDVGFLGNPITIKDYAYNSIPNQPILAGQTNATGIIENSFASSINLFPNPADNHLTIALGSNNKKAEVTITDITGKVIYKTTATDVQKIEVNTEDFAKGIYVVQIQTADFIVKKELLVKY